MRKIMLVIGEVTRNQYQPARLELMHEGHQPKVVRLSNEDVRRFQQRATELYYMGYDPELAFREALEVVGIDWMTIDVVVYTAPSPDHNPDFLCMQTDDVDNGAEGFVHANLEDVLSRARGVWVRR